jgi:hypothetical protein
MSPAFKDAEMIVSPAEVPVVVIAAPAAPAPENWAIFTIQLELPAAADVKTVTEDVAVAAFVVQMNKLGLVPPTMLTALFQRLPALSVTEVTTKLATLLLVETTRTATFPAMMA